MPTQLGRRKWPCQDGPLSRGNHGTAGAHGLDETQRPAPRLRQGTGTRSRKHAEAGDAQAQLVHFRRSRRGGKAAARRRNLGARMWMRMLDALTGAERIVAEAVHGPTAQNTVHPAGDLQTRMARTGIRCVAITRPEHRMRTVNGLRCLPRATFPKRPRRKPGSLALDTVNWDMPNDKPRIRRATSIPATEADRLFAEAGVRRRTRAAASSSSPTTSAAPRLQVP